MLNEATTNDHSHRYVSRILLHKPFNHSHCLNIRPQTLALDEDTSQLDAITNAHLCRRATYLGKLLDLATGELLQCLGIHWYVSRAQSNFGRTGGFSRRRGEKEWANAIGNKPGGYIRRRLSTTSLLGSYPLLWRDWRGLRRAFAIF